ncbi:hypothetical protein ACRRTK_022179 [Alexandromys fortis]
MLSILLLCACLLQACLLQALLQRVPALPPCVQTCLLCAQLLLLCLLLPAQLLQALLQHVPDLPPCLLPPSLLWPLLGPEVQLLSLSPHLGTVTHRLLRHYSSHSHPLGLTTDYPRPSRAWPVPESFPSGRWKCLDGVPLPP